ncbi:hypothetical protein C8P66_10566 [Humitalea rosea]|uniref:Exopolysaccharide synthesis protein ExoD n=1 Tax=Humitalea rosea TaxID=990373 RepID=A0A2W7KJU8_9PROT|nr:exopolysaccharide biosynthesis protein [Humitalea rosea]PZW48319.1 hypothetical protein C8P66_10566 [Humitalea rosea]
MKDTPPGALLPLPGADPATGSHHAAPLSRILEEVLAAFPDERISLGDLAAFFGDRAFGLLILLLCLPSLLPGMASVFGTPMLILGAQMGLGLRVPKFPAFCARQTIRRSDLLRLSTRSSKWLHRIERFVRPSEGWFTSPLGDRLVGWLTVYVAVMLILPGPFTNGPPAAGAIIMSLGVVSTDNRAIGLGVLLSALGCLFATGVLIFIGWAGIKALGWLF